MLTPQMYEKKISGPVSEDFGKQINVEKENAFF